MFALTLIQLLWAFWLGLVASYWVWRGNGVLGGALFVALGIYVYAIIMLHRGQLWAWWLCWIPPLVSLVLAAPNVIHNAMLFLRDDPLYVDSPATILIVAVSAALFVLPAVCVLAMLPFARRQLPPSNALEQTREG